MSALFDDEEIEGFTGDEEDEFDPEDDTLPVLFINLKRHVADPEPIELESSTSETGMSKISFWKSRDPKHVYHCYLDAPDPGMILDTLELRFSEGGFHDVVSFLNDQGRTISDPLIFRLQLDGYLGALKGV